MIAVKDGVSPRCRRLIEGEDWERYGSTYKVLAALMGGFIRAGIDLDGATDFVHRDQSPGVVRLRAKYRGELTSQTRSKYLAAVRYRDRTQSEIDRWWTLMFCLWPEGAKRGATLRIALALALIARGSGSTAFTASYRQLSEIAGVGAAASFAATDTKTARRAVAHLQHLGLVHVTSVESHSVDERLFHALTTFTLPSASALRERLIELCTDDPTSPPTGESWISGGMNALANALHPAFEERGLGMNCCRVWGFLGAQGESSEAEVARRLRISRRATRNSLERLEQCLLVEPRGSRNWSGLGRDLDDLADVLGVADRRHVRTESNRLHRENRRRALKAGPPRRDAATADSEEASSCAVIDRVDNRHDNFEPSGPSGLHDQCRGGTDVTAQPQSTTVQANRDLAEVRPISTAKDEPNGQSARVQRPTDAAEAA